MNRRLMVCLAGAVAVVCTQDALAQDTAWRLDASIGLPSPAEPDIVFTLSAAFPAADYAFAGARLDFLATHDPRFGAFSDPTLLLAGPGTSEGVVTATSVTGILPGQLHFPPGMIFADPSNPIEVWQVTYTVTDFTFRELSFETVTSDFRVYPDMASSISEMRTPQEASVTIVPPAPGAVATLGLAGLALARRRR